MATAIGVIALVVLLTAGLPEPAGTIFIGVVAAYVLSRQLLLPLRAESSKTRYGRAISFAIAAAVLIADLVVVIVTYVQ